ncbi:MAG TPA: RAQPRD family integrative conjugative element protein [Azoarcus taiwanensis]|nr:RAQPRD family integrative conjugative element protein [Azoarcus taiwanensis]
MRFQDSPRSKWLHPACSTLVCSVFLGVQPALAADDAAEREQLAALARQFDLIDRLAEHAANVAPQAHARYHFDYARLRADLLRVRTGVQNFLVPQRAQPRDPIELLGDYRPPDRRSDEEGSQ